MGSRKGVVVSSLAEKVQFGFAELDEAEQAAQATDTAGPVTLLGIVDTVEYSITPEGALGGIARAYSYSLYNDSVPVPTIFFPAF
jgi:hypothetical protein